MKNSSIIAAVIAALTALAAACTSDEPSEPTPVSVVDIVTVTATDPVALEGWDRLADAPVPMVTSQRFTSDIEEGRRILVRYETQPADAALRPMPVVIKGAGSIPFDTIKALPIGSIKALPDARMQVLSRWDTGKYINFQVKLDYDGEARGFALVADRATLANEQVDLYLVGTGHVPDATYVERRGYGSFYAGKVLAPGQSYRIVNL